MANSGELATVAVTTIEPSNPSRTEKRILLLGEFVTKLWKLNHAPGNPRRMINPSTKLLPTKNQFLWQF